MNKIEKAVIFATRAHAGQYRKGTGRPYILHPLETMSIVLRHSDNEDVLAAAVLHDTVEDTSATIARIEKEFGPRVAELVASVTEDKKRKLPADATWKARKFEMLYRLNQADDHTKLIFLADQLSNLRELYDWHEEAGEAVWEYFNQVDPMFQAWFYKGVYKCLAREYGDADEILEFGDYLDWIFPRMYDVPEWPALWYQDS